MNALPQPVQRVLLALSRTPVDVFAVGGRLIWHDAGWTALLDDPLAVPAEHRSLVRARFPRAEARHVPIRQE